MVGYLSPMGDYFQADTVSRRYLCTHYLIYPSRRAPLHSICTGGMRCSRCMHWRARRRRIIDILRWVKPVGRTKECNSNSSFYGKVASANFEAEHSNFCVDWNWQQPPGKTNFAENSRFPACQPLWTAQHFWALCHRRARRRPARFRGSNRHLTGTSTIASGQVLFSIYQSHHASNVGLKLVSRIRKRTIVMSRAASPWFR